jgi:hypothetical protein
VGVSYWSTASQALPFFLPLFFPIYPSLVFPAGFLAMYHTVKTHKRVEEQRASDTSRTSEHAGLAFALSGDQI